MAIHNSITQRIIFISHSNKFYIHIHVCPVVQYDLYILHGPTQGTVCLCSVVVSVMDSHTCDQGPSPEQGNHIYVML